MTDLIYGGTPYTEELRELFPGAEIEDASDEIHEDRILITVDMDPWEYRRIAFLNGFFELSLDLRLSVGGIEDRLPQWKKDYPEYFKDSDHD